MIIMEKTEEIYQTNSAAIAREYGVLQKLDYDYPGCAIYFIAFNGNVSVFAGSSSPDYEDLIREKAKSACKSYDENNPMIDMYETL